MSSIVYRKPVNYAFTSTQPSAGVSCLSPLALLSLLWIWASFPGLILARAQTTDSAPPLSLQEAIAQLKIPPAWFDATAVNWDTTKPWKEARLEIRRLLALDDASARQAVKLTWDYA